MQEGLLLNYLRLRPLVLSNTLSQMWDRLRSFCLFNSAYQLFIAFAVMSVVATKLVIHFPITGS